MSIFAGLADGLAASLMALQSAFAQWVMPLNSRQAISVSRGSMSLSATRNTPLSELRRYYQWMGGLHSDGARAAAPEGVVCLRI